MHGDIEHFAGNILFDKDYNLVGVVDWEWSRVVPAQFMVPPVWLVGSQLDMMLMVLQSQYNKIVGYLRAAVQERESVLGLPPVLSTEWTELETWCVTSVPARRFHFIDISTLGLTPLLSLDSTTLN